MPEVGYRRSSLTNPVTIVVTGLVAIAVIGALIFVADRLGSRTLEPLPTAAPVDASLETTPPTTGPPTTGPPTTAPPTTSTRAQTGAALDRPCTDRDKIALDAATGKEIGCLERFLPSYEWVWQSVSPSDEVHVRGTSCEGQRSWSIARTADGYLIVCQPDDFASIDPIAGPGSLWRRPANI